MKFSIGQRRRNRRKNCTRVTNAKLTRNNLERAHGDLEARVMMVGENLVQTTDAEFVAVQDGDWESGTTWAGGVAPSQTGSAKVDVFIPEGRSVEITSELASPVETVNVEGTLSLAPDQDTRLDVNSMRVGSNGRLAIGSSDQRVNATNTAEIVFDGSTSVSEIANDPNRLGKGLVVNPGGEIELHGADKTPFVAVTNASGNASGVSSLAAGSGSILLDNRPSGWRTGDEIMVTATEFTTNGKPQTENFRIRKIDDAAGGKVRVQLGAVNNFRQAATLRFDHRPISGQAAHVANLTRNVVLRSESPNVGAENRGHVMIQSYDVVVDNAEFRDLGRSDKKLYAEDGRDLNNDKLVNQRGRYALHFHRNLDAPGASAANAAVVRGTVANSGPGWGLVSHSSNVDFTGNVAYDFDGAGFAAEAGDEIGTWDGNLAAHGVGDGSFDPRRFEDEGQAPVPKNATRLDNPGLYRISNGDLGFTGDGFWLQSPGVEVTNNIASGFAGRGFSFWNQGLYETDRQEEAGFRTEFIDWDTTYRTWTTGTGKENNGRALVGDLSLKKFEGNEAYGSRMGIQFRFHNNGNRTFANPGPGPQDIARLTKKVGPEKFPHAQTEIKDFNAWNTDYGLGASYITSLKISDSNFISDKGNTALYQEHTITGTSRYNNVKVEGFRNGINFGNQKGLKFDIKNSTINNDASGAALRWENRVFKADNLPFNQSQAKNN